MEIKHNQKATNNIESVNPCISIIALNVNKLNSPMESPRVAGCNFKKSSYVLPTKGLFQIYGHLIQNEELQNTFPTSRNEKKKWV